MKHRSDLNPQAAWTRRRFLKGTLMTAAGATAGRLVRGTRGSTPTRPNIGSSGISAAETPVRSTFRRFRRLLRRRPSR